jgi:hypothetical protein
LSKYSSETKRIDLKKVYKGYIWIINFLIF